MSFAQPIWFWAFGLFPLLCMLFLQNERRREKLLGQLVAARLQDRLAGTVSLAGRRWRFALLLLALGCLITSLAQPRFGYTMEQSKRKGRDVLIAIDCSRSMLATDLAPTRLARAKLAAQDFIGQLQGDRIGLIAFAGSAFLQAPLTIDYTTVLSSLAELDTTIIPHGGTNIAGAIKEAVDAFGKGESDNRCLIIFTDGEELDADGLAAAEAQKESLKIFTVGLGSVDGSLIPLPGQDGGTAFVKDESGQIVKSKLDEDRLRKIAEATGGFYVHLQNGPAEMQQIVRTGLGQMNEQEIDVRMSRRPIERYQWPLSAGLVLLVASILISERKRGARTRIAAALSLTFVMLAASPAKAEWKNPGVQQYRNGVGASEKWLESKKKDDAEATERERQVARQEFEKAYRSFADQLRRRPDSPELQFNLGAAAYKLEKDDEALLAFSKATLSEDRKLRVDAESNLANTLYQKGRKKKETDREGALRDWRDGLKHYDDALKVQPDNKLVQGYREFLRRQIEELEKEPPKQDDQQQQDEKDDKEEKKDKSDQKQDQQKSSGEQKDKDQKEQQKDQNQQSDSNNGQSKDQKDKPKNGQDKGQQPQNQSGNEEKKDAEQKKEEKGDGKQDPQKDPAKEGQDTRQSQNGKPADQQPSPADGEPGKKREGEIQPAHGSPSQSGPEQESAAEEQAAAEGKMTEGQAKNLLESLKGEDDRVQLLKPERRAGRAVRDW